MRIGLVGCGKVGKAIFRLLRKRHRVIGVYDTLKKQEREAVRLLGIENNPGYREIITQSQALFIATPDDMIKRAYMKMYDHLCGTKYIFHFSGILPAEVMPEKKGIHRASVHPFATFSAVANASDERHFLLWVQGDPEAIRKAGAIFDRIHFTLKELKYKDKTMYHLIGVFASNLMVGLVAAIHDIARKAGWKDKEIQRFVFPIIAETMKNVERYGLDKALSGPLQRGDTKTLEKHLKALRKHKELLSIYKSLSTYILNNINSASKNDELKKIMKE